MNLDRSRHITVTQRMILTVVLLVEWAAHRTKTCPTNNRWTHMDNNSNNNSKTSPNNNLSERITTGLEVTNNSRVTIIQAASNNDSVINRRDRCLVAVEIATCPSNSSSLLTIEVVACVEAIEGALAGTWAAEVAWESTTINNKWEAITTNLVVKVNGR